MIGFHFSIIFFINVRESMSNNVLGLGYRPMASNPEAGSIIWYNKSTKDQWITSMRDFINSKYFILHSQDRVIFRSKVIRKNSCNFS